jgi:hypothetical protein
MDAKRLFTRVVAGAAAGNLTVTGIQLGDELISVQRIDAAGANLVGEFTVSADDTINNTGGTSTNAQTVLVIWYKNDHQRDQFSGDTGTQQGRMAY